MRCLIVNAHPEANSLTARFSGFVESELASCGHRVELADLYVENFQPVMTIEERTSYYHSNSASLTKTEEANRLTSAEALVLVFPTWWFGPPAILKGWFDRIWTPGTAFDLQPDGPSPLLSNLRHVLMITTLNCDRKVDEDLGMPISNSIRKVLLDMSAPQASFDALSLYNCTKLGSQQLNTFYDEISSKLAGW